MTGRFWEEKSLWQMSRNEWEALCDGCGKCCLHKLEDDASGEVYYTNVACRYLDEHNCRCKAYSERKIQVPDCICLSVEDIDAFDWLPATCAYRLLASGQTLPQWHPLLSGSSESIHKAGISVQGKVLSEAYVHPDGMDEHIVHWVN